MPFTNKKSLKCVFFESRREKKKNVKATSPTNPPVGRALGCGRPGGKMGYGLPYVSNLGGGGGKFGIFASGGKGGKGWVFVPFLLFFFF